MYEIQADQSLLLFFRTAASAHVTQSSTFAYTIFSKPVHVSSDDLQPSRLTGIPILRNKPAQFTVMTNGSNMFLFVVVLNDVKALKNQYLRVFLEANT